MYKGLRLSGSGRYQGYSLLELLLVLIVVGLVIGFAGNYYREMTLSMQRLTLETLRSRFAAYVLVAHAQWQVQNQPSVLTFEGRQVLMNADGWPIAVKPEATTVAAATDECMTLWQVFSGSDKPADMIASRDKAAVCHFRMRRYRTAAGLDYDLVTGAVTVTGE